MEMHEEGQLPLGQKRAINRQILSEYEAVIVRIQKEKPELLWTCIGALLSETGREEQWRIAERYMENTFRKDVAALPKAVAQHARAMRHIEVRLQGLLVVRAQMIKRRVKKRTSRGGTGKQTGQRPQKDVLWGRGGNVTDQGRLELLQQFEELLHRMSRQDQRDLPEIGLTMLLRNLGLVDEWTKVKSYIETLLQKYPAYTPWRVASQTRHYHRINQRMMPKLIGLAQQAKNRLSMRKKRSGAMNNDIWPGLEDPCAREHGEAMS
jgi:hypothetical protein